MEYTWNRTRVTIHSFRLVGIASLVTCPVATTSFFAFTFHDFCFVLSVFARLLRASSWRKERTNACCCFLPSPSCDSPRDSKPWNHNREGYPSIHRTPRRHKGGTSTILTGCNGYSVPFTEHPPAARYVLAEKSYEHDTATYRTWHASTAPGDCWCPPRRACRLPRRLAPTDHRTSQIFRLRQQNQALGCLVTSLASMSPFRSRTFPDGRVYIRWRVFNFLCRRQHEGTRKGM